MKYKVTSKPAPVNIISTDKKATDIPISDISVARLIDDGLLVLHREMKNLLILSAHGKLEASDAKDLRDTVKLLFELKDREGESLQGLTDEELQEQLTKSQLKENA